MPALESAGRGGADLLHVFGAGRHTHRIGALDIAALGRPKQSVGGDFFDLLQVAPRRFALLLGDVAGHGVPAAILRANLQATLRSEYALRPDDLASRLERINTVFHTSTAGRRFATLFAAEYDSFTNRLQYANCGHVPPVLLRADGGLTRLESTGTVLGLFPAWSCRLDEVTLAPGDLLLACTDGVTEACDAAGLEFGEEHLVAVARRAERLSLAVFLRALHGVVRRFAGGSLHDDLTLVAARRRALRAPERLRDPMRPCLPDRTGLGRGSCSST